MNTHDTLISIVQRVRCKPNWYFDIEIDPVNPVFKRLKISVAGFDSSTPSKRNGLTVAHLFPIPEATYNEKTWRRWVFDQCRRVENHELGEWFRIDNERPFQPFHGPGEDPYVVHEIRPETDALTTQDGTVRKQYRDF